MSPYEKIADIVEYHGVDRSDVEQAMSEIRAVLTDLMDRARREGDKAGEPHDLYSMVIEMGLR